MKRSTFIAMGIVFLFVISRMYIWVARPMAFSEIIYSYMPYAHLWASGTKPYLQQWYEYPPATIPVFYVPHLIDMATRFKVVHLNYLDAYRGELLLWDVSLFSIIWLTLKKTKASLKQTFLSLFFYILVTTKAHDFLYDTMDLTFATALTFGVAAPILLQSFLGQASSWFGFFLATALKYVNAPLAPVYAVIERKNWKQTIIAGCIGFLLAWAIPLAIFRSSILVSLVYQNIRGIQIDSAPAIILRTMNVYTHSEHVIEAFKNYEIAGPLTDKAKVFEKFFFPVSLLIFLGASSFFIWKNEKLDADWSRAHFTLGYILIFFLTGRVLSTPFLLWLIPLIAIYPFRKTKSQLLFIGFTALAIFVTMTRFSDDSFLSWPIPLIAGWVRTLSFVALFGMWLKLTKDEVLVIDDQRATSTASSKSPKRPSQKVQKSHRV